MSEAENALRMWLAMLDSQGRRDGARRALDALLAEHRAEVAASRDAALEGVAQRYDMRAAALHNDAERAAGEKLRLERHEAAEMWESEARDIRALKSKREDENGT